MNNIEEILSDIKIINNQIKAIEEKIEEKINPFKREIDSLEGYSRNLVLKAEEMVKKNLVNKAFIQMCEDNGADYIFVDLENSDDKKSVFEDDGTLHLVQGKIRGCFIGNQEIKKSEWNQQARKICKEMGFKFSDLNK